MKLFTKYNRINLLATISIFLLAGISFYFLVNYIVLHQVDDDLKIEQKEIETYVREHKRLPENVHVKDQVINYIPTSSPLPKRIFTNISMPERGEKDNESFRQLSFSVYTGNQWYIATVSKSLEEIGNIIRSILIITLSTILLILIVTFIINRFLLKRLWTPFYGSLSALKDFKIGGKELVQFPETDIDEFRTMNQTLSQATERARKDYIILKEFTENASHEMQTPLAVIRSKLDLLIQDEHLTEKQSDTLLSTFNAIKKLSRLNQSLLLLAKIENRQYESSRLLDLNKKLGEKIYEFKELWQAKDIQIISHLQPAPIQMNQELADILLNNLLSNATKHNHEGGKILLDLKEGNFCISNSGHETALDGQKLFTRFYKPVENNEHTGLGLSIIKQICNVSSLQIKYKYENQLHQFIISWSITNKTSLSNNNH